MKFRSYTNHNFKQTDYYHQLPLEEKENFDVLSEIFHFKANNYILEELINWQNVPNDPIYQLIFPRKEMLTDKDYQQLKPIITARSLKRDDEYFCSSTQIKDGASKYTSCQWRPKTR